jgi:uncharacterized protein YecE (DUF72 family)
VSRENGLIRRPGLLRMGTAGWNVPGSQSNTFPKAGSHLERYATVLNCVEINSSFHRPHQKTTYERWARSTPDAFRFAVKLPRSISHAKNLRFNQDDLMQFAGEVGGLGQKFGVLLVQFPPSLAFDEQMAAYLFDMISSISESLSPASRGMPAGLNGKSTNGWLRDAWHGWRLTRNGQMAPAIPEDGRACAISDCTVPHAFTIRLTIWTFCNGSMSD